MATVIQIKRSSGNSKPSALAQGELAYSYGTGGSFGEQLFIGTGVETEGEAASIDVIGGKYFTDQLDHAIGTLTASSALLVDSNKAIDEIFIGNSASAGGTLKLNEGTNNGAHFIGLKAPNAVTASTTFTLPDGDGSANEFLQTDGSGNLSFAAVSSTITLSADSGDNDTYTTGNTLTFTGGTGIDTTVSNDTITFAIDSTVTTASSTHTLTNKTFDANGTGNSISNIEVADLASGVLDTDLSSVAGTDTTLASAKAIKAYVDAQNANQMTTFTISDDSSTTSTITQSDTLQLLGGEGINTSLSGDIVTISAEDATDSNKGIASFDVTDFTVSSGDVTVNAERIQDIAGAMFSSNTETGITATYQDGDGTIDLVVGTLNQDTTGNAATATTLETARNIAGQSFDGSANITIASTDLSNTSAITLNTATQTLSNKTLTAPKFADGGFIADANGNELILLQTETSAVNELEITNSATSNAVKIATSGDDTNIDLKISPKGSGVVDVDTSRITNVTDPSGAQDAATKAYVDSVANGLDVKESVRYASTANAAGTYDNGAGTITAGSNGAFSIDGQTPSASDRILLKDQSDATENGIYVVTTVGDGSSAYVLTRGPDADTAAELTGGTFFFVEEGTANADNGYVATHNGTPTLGTTNITFSQFSGAGQISAGDALTKTGNTLNVAVDDSSIEVSGDALQIKASGVGTNQLASNAVTTIKITDANVTNAKLANSIINVTTDSGNQDIDLGDTLTVTGGEGIDTSQSGDTLTIAAELATVSNKGVASFSADNFLVSSGAVTVTTIDGGTF